MLHSQLSIPARLTTAWLMETIGAGASCLALQIARSVTRIAFVIDFIVLASVVALVPSHLVLDSPYIRFGRIPTFEDFQTNPITSWAAIMLVGAGIFVPGITLIPLLPSLLNSAKRSHFRQRRERDLR